MLNKQILEMEEYASKKISAIAKKAPEVVGLSFGEPEFGPPLNSLKGIERDDLSLTSFLDSVKRYEDPRGSIELRTAISQWYKKLYNLDVCPKTEVMVTHGGVEAITLSILCGTQNGEGVIISDPSYMLYERTVQTLGREVVPLTRTCHDHEYVAAIKGQAFDTEALSKARLMIINSPENPSGYMLSKEDWDTVGQFAEENNLWVVHDEVYDRMAFTRKHLPAKCYQGLGENSIIINSFSKKFGIPGLRIGWMVANKAFINQAAKAHDYLYLGVNIQYEKIATRLLLEDNEAWLDENAANIFERATCAMRELTEANGFLWSRPPLGAMFLFPDITGLYHKLPDMYKSYTDSISQAVADYLLQEKKVAVVPGHVYGEQSDKHIRLVLCSTQSEFDLALQRLKTC